MKLSLGGQKNPAAGVRKQLRKKQWKNTLPYYQDKVKSDERDFASWNFIGDLHWYGGSHTEAVQAWQRALEGYAQDGLHENALGVARKIVRLAPEESEAHLALSDAYLGLEYFADALTSFRSYLKLGKHTVEAEKKAWFKKLLTFDLHHPHLIEEISALYRESGIEDLEFAKQIEEYANRMAYHAPEIADEAKELEETFEKIETAQTFEPAQSDGLAFIGTGWSDAPAETTFGFQRSGALSPTEPAEPPQFEVAAPAIAAELPAGEGKDHYDLGVVYSEMKLWDAAIAEFENASRDPSIRRQAVIGLANCYTQTNDTMQAVKLLEQETALASPEEETQDDLKYHLGVLYEQLGNGEDALKCYQQIAPGSAFAEDVLKRMRTLRGQSE